MNANIRDKTPINLQPESSREAIQHTTVSVKEAAQRAAKLAKEAANQAADTAKDAARHAAETAKEAARHAADSAKEATQRAKEAALHARETATDIYQNVSSKVEGGVVRSKEYAQQHPLPVILGTLAFGAAIGILVAMTRRAEPTFRERLTDEPLHLAREAIFAVLAPVAHRLHEGYDIARVGALDTIHKLQPSRRSSSWSNQIGRARKSLKFW
jgi:ElaB/YqjD/DUF883 family membrane-anchored ribosome-binding protein